MVKITLYTKKKVQERDGSFNIKRIEKGTIVIDRPDTYKEFEKEIRTKFNIIGKEIAIRALYPTPNDEENIRDEESYNDEDFKKASQFIVILDEEESDGKSSDKVLDNDLDIDSILDIKNELIIDENELNEILGKQINNTINNKEKITNEEEKDNFIVDNKLFESFLDNFKEKINTETENKKKLFINSIKKDYLNLERILDDKINAFNNNLKNNINDTEDAKKKMSEMKNYISFVVPDQNLPIMFKISSEKKDYEFFENKDNNYIIPEIKIENILNKKVNFKNKYWRKGENSSPEIVLPIDKNDIDISDELGINESKCYSANISIKNPKIGQKYFLKLYIGDNTLNSTEYENVTKEPLFLNIKIKEKEEEEEDILVDRKINNDIKEKPEINEKKPEEIRNDQNQNKPEIKKEEKDDNKNKNGLSEEEVNKLYDFYENEFYVSSFLSEDEMKKIIRDKGGNKDEIKKVINKYMYGNQNNENENEDEIKEEEPIKNEEPIKKEEQKKIEEKPKEVVDKPKPENKIEEEKEENNNNNNGLTEEDVDQIYDEFEDEFYVSSILPEEVMKQIIRDKGGRRDEIRKELDKHM